MSEITAKLKFTQDTLVRLTGKKVSHKEIKDNYLKLLSHLKHKKTLMIAGSQGSGKSTLSVLIKKFFLKFNVFKPFDCNIFSTSSEKTTKNIFKFSLLILFNIIAEDSDW